VNRASLLSREHLRLFCAPATNQFVSAIEPVANVAASEATLCAAESPTPRSSRYAASPRVDPGCRPPDAAAVVEAPDKPHTFDPADRYFALEQRPAADDERTELRATFGRLDAFPAPPGGVVEGRSSRAMGG